MSSNDHKKFKTEATQKTSTDTEVISDAVLLPPYSTDHVLTVTAPSSTSSLTGQVDVELEMSPDGENWCPAQTQTITAGSGGTATDGVSAEDANLNAVVTLPDPNSLYPTATYTGNKFALGSKSYDDAGNELDINSPNGGTKDFMHQLMSKDKPFNYSVWLKTKTTGLNSQPFADDYTPVIFRHGGKDKFTNLKTVQLTGTGTQNLCEAATLPLATVMTASTPFSISGWFKTTNGATGTLFSNTGGAAATGLKVDITGTSPNTVITASYLNSSFSTSVTGDFNDGEWHHIVMVLSNSPVVSQLIVVDNIYSGTSYHNTLVNDDLRGDNGFTLLGDGQQNANNANPSSTDPSKLSASLSNWSLHSEALSDQAITQLYSNGHVRNINNLPAVNPNNIEAWWKLSSSTTPEEDSVGPNDLQYLNFDTAAANLKYMNLLRHGDGGVTVTDSNWMLDTTQITSPFYDSSDTSPTQATPSFSNGMSGSFWFKVPWNNLSESGFKYKDLFRIYTSNSKAISLIHTWNNTAGKYQWRLKIGNADGSGSYHATIYDANAFLDGNWHYLTWSVQGTGTAGLVTATTSNSTSDLKLWIDGNGVNAVTAITSITVNDSYTSGSTVDNVGLGRLHFGGYQEPTHAGNIFLDNIAFYKGPLEDVSASSIYTNRNNPSQATLVPGTKLTALFKGGDGPNDTTTSVESTVSTNNTIKFIQGTTVNSNPGTTASYVGTEAPYTVGTATSITDTVIDADGATRILEEDQYGSGITMSLTKRFNTTTNQWTNVHTNDTCVCLSFNGFEDQAEYFAIYTNGSDIINDAQWRNLVLSFSGREGASTNSTTNFSFDTANHNFVLSIDGNPITNAHFVGGLGGSVTNKSFPAQERYLKWDNNSEEDYIPHAQLNSNIFESINQTTQLHEPVKDRDYKTGFVGYADESSFHSESWFTDSSFNPTPSFNNEKVKTLFGSTNALTNRGIGTSFPQRTPYPLRRPSVIGSSTATGNQYIDPERYDAATNTDGGLEAWWRWGDTTGDCSTNVNNAIGFESGGTDTRRSLKLNGTYNSEENSETGLLEDIFVLTSSDDIHVPEAAASSGGGGISLVNVIIENVQAGVCNLKNLTSPLLQYIRVKFTNSGEAQLGEGKLEAAVHYRKRRER